MNKRRLVKQIPHFLLNGAGVFMYALADYTLPETSGVTRRLKRKQIRRPFVANGIKLD